MYLFRKRAPSAFCTIAVVHHNCERRHIAASRWRTLATGANRPFDSVLFIRSFAGSGVIAFGNFQEGYQSLLGCLVIANSPPRILPEHTEELAVYQV